LNQRLKENLKEQIAFFREGVYLVTGFRVDMIAGTYRPTFRIRSMYAEQEEDHLLLQWPKKKRTSYDGNDDDDRVTSLDILNTPLAKTLSTTQSYAYMTKYRSLPAFPASVQLHLFEQKTHRHWLWVSSELWLNFINT
jgi:mitotic spindle assembly checkpoint protein MAD1